jgi:hypothetical protein
MRDSPAGVWQILGLLAQGSFDETAIQSKIGLNPCHYTNYRTGVLAPYPKAAIQSKIELNSGKDTNERTRRQPVAAWP